MPACKYHPYYQCNGPTRTEPMREQLSDEEAQQRIELFSADVVAYFKNGETVIETTTSGDVFISTNLAQIECDERVRPRRERRRS